MYMALMSVLAKPPPSVQEFSKAVGTVLMLSSRPPPAPILDIRRRIFSRMDNQWEGNNYCSSIINHPYEFYLVTGETPATFMELVQILADEVVDYARSQPKLDLRNRILILLLWLRTYPTYYVLYGMFNVSVRIIGNAVDSLWPILWEVVSPKVG